LKKEKEIGQLKKELNNMRKKSELEAQLTEERIRNAHLQTIVDEIKESRRKAWDEIIKLKRELAVAQNTQAYAETAAQVELDKFVNDIKYYRELVNVNDDKITQLDEELFAIKNGYVEIINHVIHIASAIGTYKGTDPTYVHNLALGLADELFPYSSYHEDK
jgi:ribosomal protein L17